jgi:lipopolysaccharide transport system permease protein
LKYKILKRIIITPESDNANYWKDVWSFKNLFYILAWRDIAVRYKQTYIGILWAIIRPAITITIFWLVGWLFNIPSEGVPRIILVTAAALPWQLVSTAFSDSANSLINNSGLLSKIYFPVVILPVSSVIVCLVDFLISFAILVIMMICIGYLPGWQILVLPLFLVLGLITALGGGMLFAALNVKYRDFRVIIPFIIQLGMYVSPVAFSSNNIYKSTTIPAFLKLVYALNPLVAVIDGFRWCITAGQTEININGFIPSIFISFLLLIFGVTYFRKTEKIIADII